MITSMAVRSETIQVEGIRCEGCVQRLGAALQPLEGLEQANANLMGEVTLSWDDERLARDEIVRTLERAGFQPAHSRE
jgi:copper chaperone CopZ